MPKLSFPIRSLMLLVVWVALGFAGLRNHSLAWKYGIFCLAIGSLLFSIIGSIVKQGNERLPWLGYSTFGVGYVVSLYLIRSMSEVPDWPTDYVLVIMALVFIPTETVTLSEPYFSLDWGNLSHEGVSYFQIGHSLAILLAALIGSFLARYFTSKESPKT